MCAERPKGSSIAITREAASPVKPEIIAQIIRMYSEDGLSPYRIAEQVEIDRQLIARVMS